MTRTLYATRLLAAGAFLAMTSAAAAQGMVIRLSEPKFTVTIPDLQPFELGPHPNAGQQPTARLFGSSKDGVSLSVLTPTAEGASAQQCASWLAGSAISRFGTNLAAVQLLPAGENAWVVLFPFVVPPIEQLKAYVVAGNGKGRCLEVHVSRIGATEQQRQQWLAGFRNVRVEAD